MKTRLEEVRFPADGGFEMGASLALPDSGGPHPAVLVLFEAFGLNNDIRRIASRFADAGYAAMAPNFYDRGPSFVCMMRIFSALRRGDGECFRDLDAARAWLTARDDVDGSRVAVAGFCMGGGFALLYAVKSPVGAAAPFYGAVPKSASDLEGICPVVGGYGGRDKLFAGQGRRLIAHLDQLGVENDVVIYDDAGHSFMNRHHGVMARIGPISPMKAAHNPVAAEDSWTRMLAFFDRHLGR